ncbi:MAG: class II aldolase/adducin family protein [Dehalococcoidia bacterium]
MSRWEGEKRAVHEAAKKMHRLGLVDALSGNVSLYLGKDGDKSLVAITPRGCHWDMLKEEEVVIIDFEGEPMEGEQIPSSETLTHLAIYKARPEIKAVIHTHSVFASALAVAGKEIPPIIDELVAMVGGGIRAAKYGFPASEELARNAVRALEGRTAALLRNHGMVGIGISLTDALAVCELVERASQIYVYASAMGEVNSLAPEIVKAEQEIFRMLHRIGSVNSTKERKGR